MFYEFSALSASHECSINTVWLNFSEPQSLPLPRPFLSSYNLDSRKIFWRSGVINSVLLVLYNTQHIYIRQLQILKWNFLNLTWRFLLYFERTFLIEFWYFSYSHKTSRGGWLLQSQRRAGGRILVLFSTEHCSHILLVS